MPEPTKIPRPFADSGDKNSIPESSGALGFASWQEGFPAITGTPFAQGGVAPKRADFNGIFNALSAAIVWNQQGGVYVYDATTDYEVGNVVLYSGDLYKCLSANGPSSVVKAPTDTTVWAKVILTTATTSAAGYMSATDKTALDDMGTLTTGTVTRLKDTSETTNSTIYKIGHVGFMYLADKFPSVNASYTYYNVATVNIKPKIETYNLCFDGNGNFAGLAWINTNGLVYIRTLASAPGNSFMRCSFTFAC